MIIKKKFRVVEIRLSGEDRVDLGLREEKEEEPVTYVNVGSEEEEMARRLFEKASKIVQKMMPTSYVPTSHLTLSLEEFLTLKVNIGDIIEITIQK